MDAAPPGLPPTRLWGVKGRLEPCIGGHRNRVLRSTGPGERVIFKSTRRGAGALAWLGAVHDRAEAAGFAVPRLIPARTGRLIESGWTCEPELPGRQLTPTEVEAVLPGIARFHDLCHDIMQRPGFASARALCACDRGGDVDLTLLPENLRRACRAAWRALPPDPLTVVHGDLSHGNLLWCPDGRIGLIDWDEARVDAPVFDRAALGAAGAAARRAAMAWEIACSWVIEPAHARRLAARFSATPGS
ncbi:hypothetical protein EKE94_16280 [Mesobaculum littorinae]|uniref:Aminoglycoside phosphotransferase domain-containing protein n=1 Tax=Mesobaculum littorinae TaxID=2486419 RepID=A0A438ADW9_9RHOB|nr:aminoglycoside phosphotransferase family protein [Mesobaculum littorinae]RVV96900.1 hypothetical protein EKE94_16280 [Mesobaculum littorinae]